MALVNAQMTREAVDWDVSNISARAAWQIFSFK